MTLDDMRALTAYVLADMAQCESPDSHSSPGAKFLDSVRDEVVRAIEDGRITIDDFDDNGQSHSIADDAPSIWTHERWRQFVDLGAYHEEPELDDAWPKDLNKTAAIALYQIADRLTRALCEAWREGWTCPVCKAGVDEGCDMDGCGNPAGALVGLAKERTATLAAEGEPDDSADADGPVKAPEVPVEPLPVRTRGASLAEAMRADSEALSVFTGPVDLPPVADPILSLIDQAEASDMGIRVTRAAMAHDRAVSRFRRRVWTGAGVLAVVIIATAVVLTV